MRKAEATYSGLLKVGRVRRDRRFESGLLQRGVSGEPDFLDQGHRSTAQFLDWFKRPFPNQGYYEWARRQAERYRNPDNPERFRVLLEGPIGASVQTFSGRLLHIRSDGTVEMSPEDAQYLLRTGWTKIAQWPAA